VKKKLEVTILSKVIAKVAEVTTTQPINMVIMVAPQAPLKAPNRLQN